MDELKKKIFSEKDRHIEEFLKVFGEQLEQHTSQNKGLAADLIGQKNLESAQKIINNEGGVVLMHKIWPFVKDLCIQNDSFNMSRLFADIDSEEEDIFDMSERYGTLFNEFINDSESVQFFAANMDLIKDISLEDAFTLIYFNTLTSRRKMGDNCLQLLITGASSTGKTMFIEMPLQESAHHYTSDEGVGRFRVKEKNTLLLHDVDISVLVKGKDKDKLKAISRGEVVSIKIDGAVETINSIHMLATSNQNLNKFVFKTPRRASKQRKLSYPYYSPIKMNQIDANDLDAVKKRYLEMFIRQQPKITKELLPNCGYFKRSHAIVGLFPIVIFILFKYNISSFCSSFMYLYALAGLGKNIHLTRSKYHDTFKSQIFALMKKYQLSPKQSETIACTLEEILSKFKLIDTFKLLSSSQESVSNVD